MATPTAGVGQDEVEHATTTRTGREGGREGGRGEGEGERREREWEREWERGREEGGREEGVGEGVGEREGGGRREGRGSGREGGRKGGTEEGERDTALQSRKTHPDWYLYMYRNTCRVCNFSSHRDKTTTPEDSYYSGERKSGGAGTHGMPHTVQMLYQLSH